VNQTRARGANFDKNKERMWRSHKPDRAKFSCLNQRRMPCTPESAAPRHFANQSSFFISMTTEAMPSTSTKSEPEHAYKEMYSKSRRSALPPKTEAPDFTLRSTPDQWLSLSEFRSQPVVLAFYPADWSPVCGDQMALYNEMLKEFHDLGAELIGISVDGAWCHAAFARDRKLHFPLLADFEPKGDVARRYGVYRYKDGVSERALFVIDADGKVYWSFVSPIGVNPGADGILSALEDLQNKQTVPATMEAK
jgi:peroxiredoxin